MANPMIVNAGLAVLTNLLSGLGGTVPKYCAHGTGSTAPSTANTALGTETDSRATGTPTRTTTTATNDTLHVVGAVTCGGTAAITEAGLFDASSSGNMFTRGTFTAINVVATDTVTYTWNVSFTGG